MATALTRKAPAADAATHGFTLLELLIALAIAALLFVFVVPAGSQQRDHAELANAARAMAAGLRMTRLQAINAGRSAVFAVDIDNAVYQPAGAVREALPRGTRLALVTQRRETAGAAMGDIRFFPDGSSTGGAVTLSRGGDRFEVLVNWLTGGVSVHEQAAQR
ncbi:MAG: GspH/FimT family pseudopilin [Alphaproteobacteria bacterium]|nr:GspH/FimT family pseudopilin [Alphaproteobacteria bacterium]